MCVAKKYLQQVELCERRINNKLEDLARLRDQATSVTANLSSTGGGFGGGHGDKVGAAVCRIVDLDREINEDIDKCVDLKREIMAVIDKVDDPDYYDILHKRYLHLKTWEQIAEEMHADVRTITKKHGPALQSIAEILKSRP